MEIPVRFKDPDSTVDFQFDWSEHFTDDDTIESAIILPVEGLTVESSSVANNIVTVWCSGGTVGSRYMLTCRIVTTAGRTEDASAYIAIKEK